MGERPLTDADYDRLADALNRFHGERAMNLEQLDGFFAALICGPDLVRPSEYLPEIWGGGEMADEEAFASQQQLKDFLDLVMRHWNAITETVQSGDVHLPLLLEESTASPTRTTGRRGSCAGWRCGERTGVSS